MNVLTRLSQCALVALMLATAGCYHHHGRDDGGWRDHDRDHRHARDRDHRYDRDDRGRNDRYRGDYR